MKHIKLSQTRIPVLRGGSDNLSLLVIAVFTIVFINIPISIPFSCLLKSLIITVADVWLFIGYTQHVSEIIISKYRLMIITPFSHDTFKFSEIKTTSYSSTPLCFAFSFKIVDERRKKRYWFRAIDSSIGSYNETIVVLENSLVEGTGSSSRRGVNVRGGNGD